MKRAWSTRGHRILTLTIKHPIKMNAWGCLNIRGLRTFILFTETLNEQRMMRIYQRDLLKSVAKWFEAETDNWILEEDNDSKHRSDLCRAWKAENGIVTFDWPAQSPDANPM